MYKGFGNTNLSATCFASCGWLLPVSNLIEFVAMVFAAIEIVVDWEKAWRGMLGYFDESRRVEQGVCFV